MQPPGFPCILTTHTQKDTLPNMCWGGKLFRFLLGNNKRQEVKK